MNINSNNIYQAENQTALVDKVTQESQVHNHDLTFISNGSNKVNIIFTKDFLNRIDSMKLPPVNVASDKVIKIKIGMNKIEVKLKGNTIGSSIFNSIDKSLVTSIIIPEGIEGIEDFAFCDCISLKQITMPNSLRSIGCNAFDCCTSLTSINIPRGVISISACTFQDCINLKRIELPDTIKVIGNRAFARCGKLESIRIPEGAIGVGHFAFTGCEALKEVYLPSTLQIIGELKFDCYESLRRISIPANFAYYFNNQIKRYENLSKVEIKAVQSPSSKLDFRRFQSRSNQDLLVSYYSNKEELEIAKGIMDIYSCFNYKAIYKYLNINEHSRGMSSKLDWSWKF